MRFTLALVFVLAACTDEDSSIPVTSHVLSFEFPASQPSQCFEKAPADVDGTTPGAQYECAVSDVRADGAESKISQCSGTVLLSGGTSRVCWKIRADMTCNTIDHMQIAIDRRLAPGDGTMVSVQCVTL